MYKQKEQARKSRPNDKYSNLGHRGR